VRSYDRLTVLGVLDWLHVTPHDEFTAKAIAEILHANEEIVYYALVYLKAEGLVTKRAARFVTAGGDDFYEATVWQAAP
jgi:hypothetical protein